MFPSAQRACGQRSTLNEDNRDRWVSGTIEICQFRWKDMVMVAVDPSTRAKLRDVTFLFFFSSLSIEYYQHSSTRRIPTLLRSCTSLDIFEFIAS